MVVFMFMASFLQIQAEKYLIGEATDCYGAMLKNASSQIVKDDGSELKATNWTTGETHPLRCKNDSSVWVNGIRNIDGVDVDAIDQYSGTKQNGNIRVACKEGTFHPDIFIGQNIWCKKGCQPIPDDDIYYWNVTYPLDSLTTDLSSPPLQEGDDVVKLACRSGYAPRQITRNETRTKCSEGKWVDMDKFIECVPGCGDITRETGGRKTLMRKRSGSYAPFVAGDTVTFECESGEVVGNSTVTCNSLNTWYPELPVCSSDSQTISGLFSCRSFWDFAVLVVMVRYHVLLLGGSTYLDL